MKPIRFRNHYLRFFMDILVRQAKIIDPSSPFHQQTADLFIQNGFITKIGDVDATADVLVHQPELCVMPGFTDIFSNFCDPGFEYKETLASGANAAATGGFTDVMVLPNTAPPLHNKAAIEYIVQRSKDLAVTMHPIAAITKNTEGKELAEMYDMHQSGAVAFSDGLNPVQLPGILLKALQYLKAIDKTIIQLPNDKSIAASGLMNEGIVSTRMGLPGKPALAEAIMVQRDIDMAQYTASKIHITAVSTLRSVELIRQAKKQGISVTCSVTPYHLCFTDEDLGNYETNLKVNPPLRTKTDQEALKAGLADGTIDCIATHHLPQDADHKQVEFEYAQYGMTGLETTFAVLRTFVPELSLDKLVSLLSFQPRKIFDLPQITIQTNNRAALSLLLPNQEWTFGRSRSLSQNTPFLGCRFTGRPVGIINKHTIFLNEL